MKTRTRLSIFSLLLLLIPLIGCSSSSETTDVSSSNAEQSDTAVEEESDTAVEEESDIAVEQEPVSLSPADIGEQLGDAVWEVVTDACGTETGGSSFAIAPNIFITNEHVIEADMTPTLISRNGETLEGVVLSLIHI